MIHHPNITEYIDYAKANPSEINEERKLLIENICLPTLRDDTIEFDVETYEKCIAYCETNYYKLFPYQKFIYAFVFMYKGDFPVFATFVVLMGRGNGKDGCFMPLMNFLMTPMYGVKNYNIDIVANNEDQAKDSFKVVYDMLEAKKTKFKKLFFWTKEIVSNLKTKSELRYNTSNAKTKDGKKAGALLFNEFHAYENYEQVNVFSSELGKIPHARTFIITTQGYVREGPLDEILDLCNQILKSGENELGYFPFLCKINDEEDADNQDKWILANPSLPFMPVLRQQILHDYLEMKRLPSKRPEFLTKRMNLPSRNEAVTVASWEDIVATTKNEEGVARRAEINDGDSCVIGIDYADIRDFASAGILVKNDGEWIWRQKSWICKNSPFFESIKFPFNRYGQDEFCDFEIVDEKSLSIDEIADWCVSKMDTYDVQKIVMDTYRFNLFRKAFEDRGITVETKQNPYGMVRMIRHVGSINTLTAPIIEAAFVDRKINFGPSAIMRWYVNNTSVAIDKYGNKSYGKVEPKLRKNDGFMAFVMAMSSEALLDETIIYI